MSQHRSDALLTKGEELASALRPAWVDVDLDALGHNLQVIRRQTPGTRLMAVVKADAYGHGAAAVSRALAGAGVDWLGVALLEEGAKIRRAGVETPILVLGTARPAKIALYQRYRLVPTVSSLAELGLWRDWVGTRAEPQPIHLKVDTGMGRLGVAVERAPELVREATSSGIQVVGLMTHLA
ncbi:MAG TPA: alanine racemase, partial [Thermoanaerobaculia bacterium]|nr:alanine racemase [Thermoanaerobaculia bacterium]